MLIFISMKRLGINLLHDEPKLRKKGCMETSED